MSQDKRTRIRELNDKFRNTGLGGKVIVTAGVNDLGPAGVAKVMAKVRSFSNFTEENDPHGEHDFGSVEADGRTFFWKIDYYDPSLAYGSNDPSDPKQTTRVLTVMLAEEY